MDRFYSIKELDEETLDYILGFEKDGMYLLADEEDAPCDSEPYRDAMVYPVYHAAILLLEYYRKGHKEVYDKMSQALRRSADMGFGYAGFMSEDSSCGNLLRLIEDGVFEVFGENSDIAVRIRELVESLRVYDTDKVRELLSIYDKNIAFTYGTLMKGQRNHHYLRDENYIGDSVLKDYGLLELGSFPGAIKAEGMNVYGELYSLSEKEKENIDYLEGSLYVYKECFFKSEGKLYYAGFYEYAYPEQADRYEFRIPYGKWDRERFNKDDYVWYVSYGSNLCYERFMKYIDRTSSRKEPVCKENIIIDHPLYFDSYSNFWGGAKAFIDTGREGKTYGVKYLIGKDQFDEIMNFEGDDYDKIVDLGPDAYGIRQLTFTTGKSFHRPSLNYLQTIRKGLYENYHSVEPDYIINRMFSEKDYL